MSDPPMRHERKTGKKTSIIILLTWCVLGIGAVLCVLTSKPNPD